MELDKTDVIEIMIGIILIAINCFFIVGLNLPLISCIGILLITMIFIYPIFTFIEKRFK